MKKRMQEQKLTGAREQRNMLPKIKPSYHKFEDQRQTIGNNRLNIDDKSLEQTNIKKYDLMN